MKTPRYSVIIMVQKRNAKIPSSTDTVVLQFVLPVPGRPTEQIRQDLALY